jgi:predicted Zn-dependent protease
MTDAQLSALAHRALAAASGEAQARVLHVRGVRPGRVSERVVVEIACVAGGRVGVATTTGTDDAALERAAAAAAAARASDPRGGYPGLPAPAAGRPHEGWDRAVARLAPDELPSGVAAARASRVALASSSGIDVFERRTRVVGADGAAAPGLAALESARAARGGLAVPDLETPGSARAELPPPTTSSAPRPPAAGEHRAVLSAAAVAVLLEALGRLALNGLALAEGRSPLAGRLGARVAASAVNLSESPRFAGTLPRSYDAEGVPVTPVPLIQDGVAHRVVHDTRSAALAGAASTGHAGRPGGSPGGPRPRNLVLVGGGADDEAELVGPVDAGVYVSTLRDLHVIDATAGVVSALADGWHLSGGEPAEPLATARFTGSPLAVLAAVEALTMRQRVSPAGTVCPALRTGALRLAPA